MDLPKLSAALLAAFCLCRSAGAQPCEGVPAVAGEAITLELVTSSLQDPVDATAPPGDTGRLFVVEQRGRIRVIDLADDSLAPTPFLDISSKVSCCGERGLLGLAFHPDYAANGFFYVNYTRSAGSVCSASPPPGCPDDSSVETVVARYSVSAEDPDVADPASEEVLLAFCQPFGNHNAGQVAFGPLDGYLYIATGDGGSGGDPCNSGQRTDTYLGKILRIDVDGGDPYAIPPDNPFVAEPDVFDEIWALGLRNPWRFAFDRETGDLYIADVGQGSWEEVDYQPASSSGGENYQWRRREGDHTYNAGTDLSVGNSTGPLFEYAHGGGFLGGCSITGGKVYRGCRMPDIHGTYFFADYCNNWVGSFRIESGEVVDLRDRTAELNAGIQPGDVVDEITAFGEDARGEVYICDQSSKLFRVVPDESEPPGPQFLRGDTNSDGSIDISDGIRTLLRLFAGGVPAACEDALDADDNGVVEISDAVYTFGYLFLGSTPPPEPGPAACGEDPTEDDLGCEEPPDPLDCP